MGFPIRTSPGQRLFATSPELIAGYYVLHRHIFSSHPPYTLNALHSLIADDASCVIMTSVRFSLFAIFSCESSEKSAQGSSALTLQSGQFRKPNVGEMVYDPAITVKNRPVDSIPRCSTPKFLLTFPP